MYDALRSCLYGNETVACVNTTLISDNRLQHVMLHWKQTFCHRYSTMN